MSFDLSSWLWWRLLSVVMAVVMWLLLAFGVGAVPLSARRAPWAPRVEAAGRFLASEPREGRLNWTARRFELWAGPQLRLSFLTPRREGSRR